MSKLRPEESLEYWSSKILIDPETFAALSDQAKAMVFFVRGLASGDQLNDIWLAVQESISSGLPFADFQKQCAGIFEALGWTGTTAWRADLIYRNAIQSAYMAGQYAQMWDDRDIMPYWQYVTARDSRVRPAHRAMHGRVWPADHAIWKTWWPPNGHNCRCSVLGLTPEEVAERGISVESFDPTGDSIPIYDKKGMYSGTFILHPDAGWASNAGLGLASSSAAYFSEKTVDFQGWIAALLSESIVTDKDAELLLAAIRGSE